MRLYYEGQERSFSCAWVLVERRNEFGKISETGSWHSFVWSPSTNGQREGSSAFPTGWSPIKNHSKSLLTWLAHNSIDIFPHPALSLDLSPIKPLRKTLKTYIRAHTFLQIWTSSRPLYTRLETGLLKQTLINLLNICRPGCMLFRRQTGVILDFNTFIGIVL